MDLDVKNEKVALAFKESLQKQVLMRLGCYNLEQRDIDSVVNYIFNRVKGQYVDARYLNATYHQAITDLGIANRPVFTSARFPETLSHAKSR